MTPYYFNIDQINVIIDPTDPHKSVTHRVSLFEFDFQDSDVLSISTIEHIGTGDYNLPIDDCREALLKILNQSKSCLITFPIGYNLLLDRFIFLNNFPSNIIINIVYRSRYFNDWHVTTDFKYLLKLKYGPQWANGIVVIEK